MAADRLPHAQRMILAENREERAAALEQLQVMQEDDFYGILKVMAGYPVCIRLLDPPLHEFLPRNEQLMLDITTLKLTGATKRNWRRKKLYWQKCVAYLSLTRC